MAYADEEITGWSTKVINKVIWETKEVTNDTGQKINADRTKYMNTSKYKHKNMQPKTQNINYEYHMKGPRANNSRESKLFQKLWNQDTQN